MRMSISTTSGRSARRPLDHLVAVVALGDDLEAVGGRQDPRHPGADERLVVDERHADHARTSGGCVVRVERQPALDAPAVGRRAGLELAAEGAGPLAHPDEPEAAARGRRRHGTAAGPVVPPRASRRPSASSQAARAHAACRRVPGHVGERLPGDPVERVADGRRDRRARRRDAALDGEPARAVLVHERGDVGRRRPAAGRCPARRCGAPDGAAQIWSRLRRPTVLGRRAAPARPRRGRGAARGGRP